MIERTTPLRGSCLCGLVGELVTESEWLAYDDADSLRVCLIRRFDDISDRKMHLFACACCRRVWHLLRDHRSRHAVEVAARFADGLATRKELAAARGAAVIVAREPLQHATETGFQRAARAAAQCAQRSGREAGHWASDDAARAMGDTAYFGSGGAAVLPIEVWTHSIRAEAREQAPLFRDIFGNPFRPVNIDPGWLTWHDATVPKIAQAIYDNLSFDDVPVLGDALEEAGCTDSALLDHCRKPGVHVRGCWVLDLLLGRP
jgi:hypothetical protein